MQIGYGKQGVIFSEYGCARGPIKSGEPRDGMGFLGWIEPAGDDPQWIMWFDAKGDAVVYVRREAGEAIVGDPIRLKARGSNITHFKVGVDVLTTALLSLSKTVSSIDPTMEISPSGTLVSAKLLLHRQKKEIGRLKKLLSDSGQTG